jgi:hypothetical protein
VLTTEGGVIHEEYRVEYVADRVQTTATAFMGLTLQCARCHDHKFDPVSQREYFQLFAFFNSIPDPLPKVYKTKSINVVEPFVKLRSHADEAALIAINDRLGGQEPDANTAKEIAAINNRTVNVMVMADLPEPRQAHVLDRGQYDAPRDPVAPGVPAFLPPLPAGGAANRLALARWLVDPRHPLTARVAVNRWWEMLFGRGRRRTAHAPHRRRLLLCREPAADERAAVRGQLAEFRRHFAADTVAARKLLALGPDAKHGRPAELAAWTMVAGTLLCLVRSMHTEAINHDPAITFLQTVSQQPGRASFGAWLSYGLGSEADDLPSFVVMLSQGSGEDSNQGLLARRLVERGCGSCSSTTAAGISTTS